MEFLNNIHWRSGQSLTRAERNLIIYFLGAGFDNRDIAIALSRGKRTIDKWVNRFQNTGEMQAIKHVGRQRATTIQQDLDIALCATERPRIINAEIKQELGLDISLVTIGKRLRESKLFCRVARQKEHLSVGHKAQRLQFAQNFQYFDNWEKTIFVDESTFMTGHAVRTLVRRPIGTAFEERFIVEKAQSGRRSVPVFGVLCSGGIGPLVRIEGRFDAEKYIEILDETVLPFVEDNFPDGEFYYYQDNSPIHRANIVRQWFDHNLAEYQLIQTPAKSPDINPIENLWGRAKVKVANDGIYANEEDLWLAITDSWLEMQNDMQYAVNLIDSIPNRLEAIINANGSYTKY